METTGIVTYLLDFMVLPEKRVGAVGDTHGDNAHGADHDHGHVNVWKHGHERGSYGEPQRAQDVDHSYAKVVIVQVLLQ